jgi:deoxycytidine triphosphate deaminase
MPDLATDLRVATQDRLRDFDTLLDGLTGRLAATEDAARRALGVFSQYRQLIEESIDRDWEQFEDPQTRTRLLRFYLRDIGARLEDLEEWFLSGADAVPPSLVDAVVAECEVALTTQRSVMLAIGDPDNMATLVKELPDLVFGSVRQQLRESEHDDPVDRFALIQVSRLEAQNPIWRPLIVGHEVSHLGLLDRPLVEEFGLGDHLDEQQMGDLDAPRHLPHLAEFSELAIATTAEQWLEELICDAYAVRRWGPSAVAALGAYFEQVGAIEIHGSHPPGWFRLRLMLEWLGAVDDSLEAIIEPWLEVAEGDYEIEEDWAAYLLEVFADLSSLIPPLLDEWVPEFDSDASSPTITRIADGLCEGIPLAEWRGARATTQEIICAAWLARSREHPEPLYRLVDKSLELSDFLMRWWNDDAPPTPTDDTTNGQQPSEPVGLLTAEEIGRRTSLEGDDKLVISPLLPRSVKETGIDLRLGRYFIVFQRTSTGSFDALSESDDPRSMQRAVERRWGEPFVLHSGELVLATTLEYVALPGDLGAQVITRSSYGRLGLITATAIQVHPLFMGCLTLELVNLGALPIELHPGERIAQLVISTASPKIRPGVEQKYRFPTRPEFSKVQDDWDAPILRRLRRGRSIEEDSH